MARSSDLSRLLDQKGGRIAAALIGPLRNRRRPLPDNPKRIAIIQPTAIGDTVIGSGAVAAIRRRYPNAELAIFHGASNGAAVALLPGGARTIETSFANPLKALAAIRAFAPELAIDLTPWPYTTAIVARLAAPVAVGFDTVHNDRGRLFDIVAAHRIDRHERDNLAAMAHLFDDAPYEMTIARAPHGLAPGEVAHTVLCHVRAGGSSAASRQWPDAYWIDLARALGAAGYRVGFTGAPGDAAAIDAILAALGPQIEAFSLAGRLTLAELADLIARVPLLVSVDTGVVHLASAVGGRVLALYGPSRSWRWGPLSPHGRSIDSSHPGAGYVAYGFERSADGPAIMPAITAQAVIDTALAMLASGDARP